MNKKNKIEIILGSDKKQDFEKLKTERDKKEFIEENIQIYSFDTKKN